MIHFMDRSDRELPPDDLNAEPPDASIPEIA
jgi:hypothetical protein